MPDVVDLTEEVVSRTPGRILVVDDDRATRFLVSESLQRAGFVVFEAADGAEALTCVESFRPDVVLLDIVMPVMDGFETCAALRASRCGRHTPVVMITGLDDAPSIHRAFEVGATSFVTKPLNYLILGYRLRYMVRSKRIADRLRESEARLGHAQRLARLGHWEWDAEQGRIQCSATAAEIFGLPYGPASIGPADFLDRLHPADRRRIAASLARAVRSQVANSLEYRIQRRDGERVIQQEMEFTADDHGEVRLLGTCQDITDRRRSEERIRALAYFDPLTGLPNRTFVRELLSRAIGDARRNDGLVAVLHLDLDQFKRINDSLGHHAGDRLLLAVADRLGRMSIGSRPRRDAPGSAAGDVPFGQGTVARVGGDEFVVILDEIGQPEDAAGTARRIAAALSEPVAIDDAEVAAAVSIGISIFPVDGDDADTLLKNAEAAVYQAKAEGRDRHLFFTAALNERAVARFGLETGLRKALERDELVLHYQPQIDLRTREIIGVEALVRWRHATKGLIPPNDFIPVAEETGLIVPIGDWVLQAACSEAAHWRRLGLSPLRMSVNLSAVQFKHTHLVESIWGILQRTGLDPACLGVELTESHLIQDVEATVGVLNELSALGIAIVIDDFGTGYSSLSYLKRILLSALKIDRSFVRDVTSDADDVAIVKATIALAHSLRLRVVAEGVEHPDQLALLAANDCDEAQGYFFSRPIPAEEFVGWYRAFEARRRRDASVRRV